MQRNYITSGLLHSCSAFGAFYTKNIERAAKGEGAECYDYIARNFLLPSGDCLKLPSQEHGSRVWVLSNENELYAHSKNVVADAVVTNLQGIAIGVRTADCIPILLSNNTGSVVSAIHAGWRGALSGVIQNAIESMRLLGGTTSSIFAAIGPAIRQYNYEVDEEFFLRFLAESSDNRRFFLQKDQKYLFDLPGYCKNILSDFNIFYEDIGIDTYTNHDIFASYRKAKHLENSGYASNNAIRNLSLIKTANLKL